MIANPACRAGRRNSGWRWLVAGLVTVVVLLLAADALLLGVRLYAEDMARRYQDRIYPRTSVLGLDLGGLTAGEAASLLEEQASGQQAAVVLLRDGERLWSVRWQDLGLHVDAVATAQAAYRAGRGTLGLWERLRNWLIGQDVPVLVTFDEAQARQALEALAAQIGTPPVDAGLRLQGTLLEAVPGQPGQELDLPATLERLQSALATGSTDEPIEVVMRTVAPQVRDAGPVLQQAADLVERRMVLVAYDVLTDETFAWELEPEMIFGWLQVMVDGHEVVLRVNRDAVRGTLAELAADLGDGRGLRLEDGAERVAGALEAGGGTVDLYLTHPARSHQVQAGDTLEGIALRYGIPSHILAEANPDVQPERLLVGESLVIPSVDVLMPYLPVHGKRIVISIREQRLRVYENATLRWEWPVSTGIDSSPTLPGTFQILSKSDRAYASQWSLWMPQFMAIYRTGPDLYNGIHALPILSSGERLWEGLLGKPASYGCIILGIQEAETLYAWAEVGVPVIIEP